MAGIITSQEMMPPAKRMPATRGPMMYPTPRYSEVMARRKDAPGYQLGRFSGCAVHACTVFIRKVYTPPRPSPQKTRPAKEPPRSPATRTSAHAVPSGNVKLPCSLTISCRRSGIISSTPSHPPISARKKTRQYSVFSENPRKIRAGRVKITPAAADSPAEPVVWTMLFSRIVDLPNARRMEIDSTEMGIDAETVSPARNPTYTDTAPNKMPNNEPKITARQLNSVIVLDVSTQEW